MREVTGHGYIWLCTVHHRAYDSQELDLYPLLDDDELREACQRAGGPGHALRRVMGAAWRRALPELLDERLAHLRSITTEET